MPGGKKGKGKGGGQNPQKGGQDGGESKSKGKPPTKKSTTTANPLPGMADINLNPVASTSAGLRQQEFPPIGAPSQQQQLRQVGQAPAAVSPKGKVWGKQGQSGQTPSGTTQVGLGSSTVVTPTRPPVNIQQPVALIPDPEIPPTKMRAVTEGAPTPPAPQQPTQAAGAKGITGNWKTPYPLPKDEENKLIPIPLPQRKKGQEVGTYGKGRVTIKVNHFPLKIKFNQDVYYRYDIQIKRIKAAGAPEKTGGKPGGPARRGRNGGGGGGGEGPPPEKKMPKRPLQKIIKYLVRYLTKEMAKAGKNVGIASDFRSNMYSTLELEFIGLQGELDLSPANLATLGIADPDPDPYEKETGKFAYTLIRAPDVPARQIETIVNNMTGTPNSVELFTPLEVLFNAVIKAMPRNPYLCMGRSVVEFPEGGDGFALGGGLRAWMGVNACITPGWKPFICMIPTYQTVKVGANVLVALKDLFGGQDASNVTEWSRSEVEKASEYMCSTKIEYSPSIGKELSCTIERVSYESVSQAKFDYKPNPNAPASKISVFDYFKKHYNRTLKYPNGPILITKGKGNMIPAELSVIKAGQSVNRRLDPNQTTKMKDVAQKKPDELYRSINEQMRSLNLTGNELFRKFGMDVNANMLTMEVRVLDPPEIKYKGVGQEREKCVIPDRGAWQIWQYQFKFQKPHPEEIKWAILAVGTGNLNADALRTFKSEILKSGSKCGMNFNQAPIEVVVRERLNDLEYDKNIGILKKYLADLGGKQVKLVVVVIPGKPSGFYAQVKQAAELEKHGLGMLTQAILRANFAPRDPKKLPQIVQNLLLKINSKLDGVTHHVSPPPNINTRLTNCMSEPTLILGADVRHPAPGTSIKGPDGKPTAAPSFAAVTACMDRSCMPAMMEIRAQVKEGAGADEVIKNLDEIVGNMINTFGQRNGRLPVKILYYRDGVGSGQFQELLHVELDAIRRACGKFDKNNGGLPYEPKITFVTVQKRHKTRFMMQERNGRISNAPPGTVVDKEIVHPNEIDFYLLSHQGIQGTSHPTRYHLLWDDNDYSMNELQMMTYCLCHMYARCNRSVKIPAATYYAHWAATRAEKFAEGQQHLFGNLDALNNHIKRFLALTNTYPMHFV